MSGRDRPTSGPVGRLIGKIKRTVSESVSVLSNQQTYDRSILNLLNFASENINEMILTQFAVGRCESLSHKCTSLLAILKHIAFAYANQQNLANHSHHSTNVVWTEVLSTRRLANNEP